MMVHHTQKYEVFGFVHRSMSKSTKKKKNECENFMHFRTQVNLREVNFMFFLFVSWILYLGRNLLRWPLR